MLGAGQHAGRLDSDHFDDNGTGTGTGTSAAPTTGSGGPAAVATHRSNGRLKGGSVRCFLRHRRLGKQFASTHSAMADAALLMGETLHPMVG